VGVVAAETVDDRFRLQGKVLVGIVAVGMAIATITLVLDRATGTRKTDIRTELQARISPIGEVAVREAMTAAGSSDS
jgi:hypothetical protein